MTKFFGQQVSSEITPVLLFEYAKIRVGNNALTHQLVETCKIDLKEIKWKIKGLEGLSMKER